MKKLMSVLFVLCAMMLAVCASAEAPVMDRAGNAIAVPEKVEKMICLAPSTSEILDALGETGALIAVDTNTAAQMEEVAGLPTFDMMTPDCEAIAALEPDVVFISGMSKAKGTNPYQPLLDLGVCVIDIPSSSSIAAVEEDIEFVGSVVGKETEAQAVVEAMNGKINEISALAEGIEEKKSVYFEISPAPYQYSFGQGTFLNEMIELIGATNIFADQDGWIPVSAEQVVAANPDVIITNADYMEDAVAEIEAREGWAEVAAVKNHEVYLIGANVSSQPCQNIVDALMEIAADVYPEVYGELIAK